MSKGNMFVCLQQLAYNGCSGHGLKYAFMLKKHVYVTFKIKREHFFPICESIFKRFVHVCMLGSNEK